MQVSLHMVNNLPTLGNKNFPQKKTINVSNNWRLITGQERLLFLVWVKICEHKQLTYDQLSQLRLFKLKSSLFHLDISNLKELNIS